MAKTIKQLQPHKFSAGDTVKVVSAGRTEWCKIGDTHTIRICKHDQKGEPVYVVDFDKDDSWIRECNLELVERDRQKGGEWKRHRGGKQPVANDTQVECRMRNGDIEKFNASGFMWDHNGQDDDIMAYRVISQPQAEEVDSISEAAHKPIIEALNTMATQWHEDQIDGPIKWRDEVTELNAYIEKYTRERDAIIERLASEGFALIPPVVSVVSEFSGAGMIFPIEEWQIGDIVQVVSVSDESAAPLGVFKITDIDASEPKYELDKQYFPNHNQMKFIRRP